jgi:hypothetical protein
MLGISKTRSWGFSWGVGDRLAIAQPYGTGKGLYTYKPS